VRPGRVTVLAVFILSVPVHLSMMRRPLESLGGVDIGDESTFGNVVTTAREFVRSGLRAEVQG
jgi:hypothetical protein